MKLDLSTDSWPGVIYFAWVMGHFFLKLNSVKTLVTTILKHSRFLYSRSQVIMPMLS